MSEQKPRFDLIPKGVMWEVARVLTEQATKHEGEGASRIDYDKYTVGQYLNKIQRHINLYMDGNLFSDDGVRHDTAIIINAMIAWALLNRDMREIGDSPEKIREREVLCPDDCFSPDCDGCPEDEPAITQCPDCKGHFSGDHACQKKTGAPKQFICGICGLGFSSYADLYEHHIFSGHPGEVVSSKPKPFTNSKPFPCDKCDASFPTYPLLNNHIEEVHKVGCCG